jgi:alanyl-tRNA synthetase
MRGLADSLRNKWQSAVVVLGTADDHGVALVVAVTKDLTQKVHAGKLIGPIAVAVGGKGGGRPDLAEAGGKDAAALGKVLESVYAQVDGLL